MDLHSFFDKYPDVLTSYKKGWVALKTEEVGDREMLKACLADWTSAQGWVSRQSQVQVLRSGSSGLDHAEDHILAAELIRGVRSLHIRRKAAGWVLTEVCEGTGTDVLIEPRTFVADSYLAGKNTGLRYHRYWVLDETECPKQLFAAFQGYVSLVDGDDA